MGIITGIILIAYIILLILVLAYSGVIAYHVLKYRSQLPEKEYRRSFAVLIAYFLAGAIILGLSMILAGISGLII